MEYFAYFGYGSLVNRKTLASNIVAAFPATLKGWRRHWQPRGSEPGYFSPQDAPPISLLTIHGAAGVEIDGLIVIDRIENLAGLDKRELEYNRVKLRKEDFSLFPNGLGKYTDIPIHTYVASDRREDCRKNGENGMILQSYLDVVMQGFNTEFSDRGLDRFVATTIGFDVGIFDDRSRPIYPRNQNISETEKLLFQSILAK